MIRNLVLTTALAVILVGCIGSVPHLNFSPGTGSTEGGLPGVPPFPDSARLPDNSGVARSGNHVSFIISSPTDYKGIARSNNFSVSSPFFEIGIAQVRATLATNGIIDTEIDTGNENDGIFEPVIGGDDGPSVPIEVEL